MFEGSTRRHWLLGAFSTVVACWWSFSIDFKVDPLIPTCFAKSIWRRLVSLFRHDLNKENESDGASRNNKDQNIIP